MIAVRVGVVALLVLAAVAALEPQAPLSGALWRLVALGAMATVAFVLGERLAGWWLRRRGLVQDVRRPDVAGQAGERSGAGHVEGGNDGDVGGGHGGGAGAGSAAGAGAAA